MAYLTFELRTNDKGGTGAELLYSGIDIRVAEQKYYEALAAAAVSGRPAHAAVILDSLGNQIAAMGFEAAQEGGEE